ncbi:hypothetical protein GCM10018793_29410 [Streptomyces sulfonofaciens]|uniref:Uncharacterized protein n=1 Tax=Streptomyces sulfonofaciens TaxID=68272 RepID=A0A919G5N4_9ACTN|nr:hypothetical protein [Streptomyces sulfonofaciens]GHH78578.1 hypothetical protein GCM10018793_29410 [Streptomyces sulfonofaciens]
MSFGQGGPQWGPGGSGSQPPEWGSNPRQPDWGTGPQQPGAPEWGPGSRTPDWAALADASESRARRRKWLMIGAGALATVAIGAVVAIAVVSANGGDKASDKPSDQLPATADIPSDTTRPGPSFAATTPPPPPDPKDYVSSAKKDTAPLGADTLFPAAKITMGDHVYTKGPTRSTPSCGSAAHGDLGPALDGNHCTRVIRATYTAGGGVAVTVGVAVFDVEAQATKAAQQTDKGNVVSLSGSGAPAFCTTAVCRSTSNSYGRYAYFTIAGFTSGNDVTKKDTAVFAAGDDLAEYTFRQIIHRGEAQASAAANGQ